MAVLDLSAYKPVPGTLEDANQIANGFTAIQACINALDNNNFAAGKIFDPAKIMQNAAVDGDAMVWDNTNSKWVPASAMPATSPKPGVYKLWDSVEAGVTFPAASITTPTLSQTFKHLRVVIEGRSNVAANTDDLRVRFNGDAAANYFRQLLQASAAVASAGETGATNDSLGPVNAAIPGATALANSPGVIVLDIPNYAGATFHKLVTSRVVYRTAQAGGGMAVQVWGGGWASTAAISTLTFSLGTGSFIAGSRITVYGEA